MTQRWNDLLYAHWRLPASAVAPLLPDGLQPDTFQGSAWIGVVPLQMDRFNLRGVPTIPGVCCFPELHLRTYVHDQHTGTPGIYNFSLDIGNLLTATAVRFIFRMPCNWAEMRLSQQSERDFAFRSRRLFSRKPVIFNARYRGLGPTHRLAEIRSGSLEYFLTERYCFFARNHRGQAVRANIHTVASPLEDAEADIERNDLPEAMGIQIPVQEPLLHYSRRLAVYVWPAELAEPTRRRQRIPAAESADSRRQTFRASSSRITKAITFRMIFPIRSIRDHPVVLMYAADIENSVAPKDSDQRWMSRQPSAADQ
jgi:uncharacterized protein YqjF (DUF2071 family)